MIGKARRARTRFLRAAALFLLGAVLAIAGCGGDGSDAGGAQDGGSEPIRVGAILSLTGQYAALGDAEKKALELEVGRINDAGGINGKQIELVIKDDATDEAKAVAAATELIDQDAVVAILGPSGTGQTMAVRTEIERAGVPNISMAGGSVITADLSEWVFQTPWPNKIVVPFVLDAIKAEGQTKIGLLSDTGGYGKDGRDVILASAKTGGLEIVADETFNPGDADMTAQLTKIRAAGAQALLLWTAGKDAVTVVKNAEQLGLEIPAWGGSGQARIEFPEGGGAAAEGFVFGTGRSLVPDTWKGVDEAQYETVSEFAKRYEDEYGEAPDIFAGHGYDAITILADAIGRAGEDADGDALRAAIEGTDGVPGFGGPFAYSADDHNGLTTKDLALFVIEGGTWVPRESK